MEESSNIHFDKSFFGHSDLEWLLNVWPQKLSPMTPAQIANWFLSVKFESEKKYLPYDRTRIYKTGDKIIIRINSIFRPAEIVKVTKKYGHDQDGFVYDVIELELLDFQLGDKEHTKTYIADYHGQEYASHQTQELEAISKDEKEKVESQVLLALSNDDRLVSFENQFFPSEYLVDLQSQATYSLLLIAKAKRPLTTAELLEQLDVQYNESQEGRWRFSLNYYLNRNRRFECCHDSNILWDIRKPALPLVAVYDKQTHQRGIHVSADLENLLYYHGFFKDCQVYLQRQKLFSASYDSVENKLRSEEMMKAIDGLLPHDQCHLLIEDSGLRGDPILLNSRDFIKAKTIHSTVTIRNDWIKQQYLKIPNRISKYMQDVNEITVISNRDEERLLYDTTENAIQGIGNFYEKKAIAERDKVRLRLLTTEPEKIFVSMWWRYSISELLQLLPEDFEWERASVRDCIIVILGNAEEPLHYRELYAEVSRHKTVSLQSVVNTLSKYSPSVFVQAGRGKWNLALSEPKYPPKKHGPGHSPSPPLHVCELVWKAVTAIEQKDYVYKLLAKARRPLTYSQIVNYLAKGMKIDPEQLAMTDFLNPKDERLKQLSDESWALSEWIGKKKSPPDIPEDTGHQTSATEDVIEDPPGINPVFFYVKKYLWVFLLVIICVVTAILIWLFN